MPKDWYFWTEVLEKLLRVPWTAGRSNQSILKDINSEYSLGRLMPKLKLQYFGHLMWRADSLEKTLSWESWGQVEKGTTEDETVGWHHPSTQWTWVWANSRRCWMTVKPGMLQSMGLQRVLPDWASKQQLLNIYRIYKFPNLLDIAMFLNSAIYYMLLNMFGKSHF